MEYRLLGPVEVEREGRVLALGGPKQRAVLAILLLRRGSSVPSDVLIEDLWGESAPPTARNALQGYVFQLRKVLEPEIPRAQPHRILVSDGAGYRLDAPVDAVDVDRFERLAAEGRRLTQRSPQAAVGRFDEALALWRGPPLADLAYEAFAQAEVNRLDERRLTVQEDRIDALLAAGRHAEVVGELEALVEQHPLRERLRGQFLLALYRSGRQSEALEAYASARSALVEQLGIDPGPELRALHLAILNQDPGLAAPTAREPVGFRPPPRPPTRLVGRDQAVAEVTALLRTRRVVTLLGPGGIGKTRLALAVAEAAAGDYPDGIAWVELETIREPELVLHEIGAAGGLVDVVSELEGRRALLVLDNLEQVLECAPSLADLVARAGDVRVLVTSREPLDVAAEHRYDVPLLDSTDAVELFRDRAEALGVSLGANEVVAGICRRFDGLPLALELAAAQTTVFEPSELLGRLDSPDLLAGTRRDAPDRHRSLHAAIEWSHSLLDDRERDVFARLGVFPGGWTLDAAERVAGADPSLVDVLVRKSLVRRIGERFTMLESIRRDARARLEATGKLEELSRAHALFVADLVAALDRERPEGWILAFDEEHPNLRAAIDWALDAREAGLALELATAARTFWETRGHVEEGARRLEAALALPGASDAVRARGLYAAAIMHARALRFADAERLNRDAVALARKIDDVQDLARALNALGIALYHLGRLEESQEALAESLELKRRLGDERGAAIALLSLGNTAIAAGDFVLAEEHQREALHALRAAGDELGVATALDDLAVLRLLADDAEGAHVLLEESLAISRRIGAIASVASALAHLGQALATTDPDRAHDALTEALPLFQSLDEPEGVAAMLESLAAWWLSRDPSRAASILGAADNIRERAGAEREPVARRARERVELAGAEALGSAWAPAVAGGRGIGEEAAVSLALEAPLQQAAEASA